ERSSRVPGVSPIGPIGPATRRVGPLGARMTTGIGLDVGGVRRTVGKGVGQGRLHPIQRSRRH
ncbi:MAG: hypothetical protein OER95_04710, partial [Acidimicrobiia bacterium]|nr:hypothetical protein [Acidimicrobiia bacterium]